MSFQGFFSSAFGAADAEERERWLLVDLVLDGLVSLTLAARPLFLGELSIDDTKEVKSCDAGSESVFDSFFPFRSFFFFLGLSRDNAEAVESCEAGSESVFDSIFPFRLFFFFLGLPRDNAEAFESCKVGSKPVLDCFFPFRSFFLFLGLSRGDTEVVESFDSVSESVKLDKASIFVYCFIFSLVFCHLK